MPTKIEWARNGDGTPGETWNPLRGTQGTWHCTKVSPECAYCYAERLNMTDLHHNGPAYQVGTDTMRLDEKVLAKPLSWRKPRVCFICSMTDLLHEQVPFEWIDRILDVCRRSPNSFFLILTKRPERALEYQEWMRTHGRTWPPNVGGGVSFGTQGYANKFMPLLLQLDLVLRTVSIEPLIEAVDLRPWLDCCSDACDHGEVFRPNYGHRPAPSGIHWIKLGGESGPNPGVRPMDIEHVRPIRDLCIRTGIPFFLKQWGEWTCETPPKDWFLRSGNGDTQWIGGAANPHQAYRVGKKAAGRLLDGREWNEFPKILEGHFANPLHGRMAEGAPGCAHRGAERDAAAGELQISAEPGGCPDPQQRLF